MNDDLLKLKEYSRSFADNAVEYVADYVLDDPRFSTWVGGLPGHHHDFEGGLVRHTREVIDLMFLSYKTLHLFNVDKVEIYLSGLFHDIGKIQDYIFQDGKWIGTSHKRLIHHISRSGIIWSHSVSTQERLKYRYHDNVLHNILSHHGQREFGSPVAPKTQAAWLLHLCDGISARMNDCDRLDLINGKKL
jgi:3'-5' exoribonuclease